MSAADHVDPGGLCCAAIALWDLEVTAAGAPGGANIQLSDTEERFFRSTRRISAGTP
jgi:hypothetical protein